jgi:hypothetical protein
MEDQWQDAGPGLGDRWWTGWITRRSRCISENWLSWASLFAHLIFISCRLLMTPPQWTIADYRRGRVRAVEP